MTPSISLFSSPLTPLTQTESSPSSPSEPSSQSLSPSLSYLLRPSVNHSLRPDYSPTPLPALPTDAVLFGLQSSSSPSTPLRRQACPPSLVALPQLPTIFPAPLPPAPMTLPTQMPLHGSTSTPKFDEKTPSLLPRFLEDVDILGTAATLTDAEKVWTSICYANLKESEGLELLPEAIVVPADWAAFALAVKGANRYCQADLQYLVQVYRAKPMWTLADFSKYKRKFMKIAQFLINGWFLSKLDRDAYFPKGLPSNFETQV